LRRPRSATLPPSTTLFRSCCDQDPVDPAAEKRGQKAVGSGPETGEHVAQRALQVEDSLLASVDRLQGVDQHDLPVQAGEMLAEEDRKSTRLNSSHVKISYA